MNCPRCGALGPFKSLVYKTGQSKFCEECQCRNLMDGLNLATPPELLDKHTRNFTLSQEQYRKEMFKPKKTQ